MVGASGGSDGDMSWESSGRLECRSTCEEWHGKAWQTRRRCVRDSQRPATTGAYPSGRVSPLSRQQDRLYIGFLLSLSSLLLLPRSPYLSLPPPPCLNKPTLPSLQLPQSPSTVTPPPRHSPRHEKCASMSVRASLGLCVAKGEWN